MYFICVYSISIVSQHGEWKLVHQRIGAGVYGRCLPAGRMCHAEQGIS